LVTGILRLFPVAFGAVITAIVQNNRRPLRGAGMAIAGLVLAGCWVVFGGIAAFAFVVGGSSSGDLGRVALAGSTTVGTCLTAPDDEDFVGTPVSCEVRHDAEIYLVHPVAGADDPWPGYSDLDADADDACYDAFEAYVGDSYDDSDYDYGYFDPDEAEWRNGERRVVCVVLAGLDDHLTGSVRNGG
jgi:hypothetical protein